MERGDEVKSYEKYAEIRDSVGMTDYMVAKDSKVSTATISAWKKTVTGTGDDKGYEPKINKLMAIASTLKVPVTDLIGD